MGKNGDLFIGLVILFLVAALPAAIVHLIFGSFVLTTLASIITVYVTIKYFAEDLEEEDKTIYSEESESAYNSIANLQNMDEYEFEKLVAEVWEDRGWTTQVTNSSNDRGVDVVAERENPYHEKIVIQAKKYSADNKVGSPEIQQYASLKPQENADQVVVVTTSSFSHQAKHLAKDLNVKLVDGTQFLNMLKK